MRMRGDNSTEKKKYGALSRSVLGGHWSMHACKETTQEPRTITQKLKCPVYIQDWEQYLVPPVKLENLMLSGEVGRVHRRMGNN